MHIKNRRCIHTGGYRKENDMGLKDLFKGAKKKADEALEKTDIDDKLAAKAGGSRAQSARKQPPMRNIGQIGIILKFSGDVNECKENQGLSVFGAIRFRLSLI